MVYKRGLPTEGLGKISGYSIALTELFPVDLKYRQGFQGHFWKIPLQTNDTLQTLKYWNQLKYNTI